ncbi:MAG: transglycosylase [Actinophytocola sp.]|nr:transglycosylase [Actinophytocola sp.]
MSRWLRGIARGAVVLAVALPGSVVTALPAASDPTWEQWAKLRICESSDRYDVSTDTGYYGAYQFDLPTWRSVGGTGKPHKASPAEQDYRALYLYRMRGWQPWECAGTKFLNLREDSDARSKVVPSYAESAYIGGEGELPAPPDVNTGPKEMPPWPGVVYDYGDCAVALQDFQLRMNAFDLGYTFTGSGCYYAQTKRAVLALQRANGIKDSGLLGPKTWRAAWHGKPPRP